MQICFGPPHDRDIAANRFWEASDPDTVVDILQRWFEPSDQIESLDGLDSEPVADRERIGCARASARASGYCAV